MCGFLGILYRDPQRSIDWDRLMCARDTMTHRGPDESGMWSTANRCGIGLAHRRLKIQDLTHGQQPMVTPDQQRALVFNGEIYNHQALRERYPQPEGGYQGDGDTETLFAGLNQARGEARSDARADAITDLHGMFAFGHYDDADRSLLLARDRLGQKPLYYHVDEDAITFGSELKSILAWLDRKFPIDPIALDHYFARGYVPAPRTIFQGIHKLPAAHYLMMDAKSWTPAIHAYWDVASPSDVDVPDDPDAIVDRLDELLTESVRERLISDVPIGCLLSGGVDSSLITAIAAKIAKEAKGSDDGEKCGGECVGGVKTFSIGFDEPGAINELPEAQQVAEYLQCDWQPRTQTGGNFMEALHDVAPFYDEPYGNPTSVAMRTLAKLCREQLVVVLSGQGGDELTAGYPGRYDWVMQTPEGKPIDDALHQTLFTSFVTWRDGRQHMLAFDAVSPAEELSPVMRQEFDRLNRVLYGDVKRNLPDYLVALEDRMTMSASLEARNPLLDHRVVDFLMALPSSMKIRDGQHKWPLVSLLRRYLPDEMVDRPKRGFTPPMGKWLVDHGPELAELIRSMEAMGPTIFQPRWWDYLMSGQYQPQHTMPIFYAVMLAMWFKHFGFYVSGLGTHETTHDHWHAAFAEQSPGAISQGQWFCQAMENFTRGQSVRLVGSESDPCDYYAFLATGCGLTVVESANETANETAGHVVLIGFDALAAGPFAGTTVVFLPFALAEKARMESALQKAMTRAHLRGYQAVQTDELHGVLIARFECDAPETRDKSSQIPSITASTG